MIRIYSALTLLGILFVSASLMSVKISVGKTAECQTNPIVCSVTGLKAASVHETRASFSYQLKGSQIIEFGICYNTEGNPTVSSLKIVDYQDEPRDVPDYISMKTSIRGLTQGTKYFVKAYIKSSGSEVSYSDEVEFSTPKEIDYAAMLNGPKAEYYPNGQIMRKYNLKDGKPDGLYQFYNDSGRLVSEQNLKEGIPDGLTTTFYRDGTKQSVTNFKDGLPEGESATYYPNGTIKSKSMCSGDLTKPTCESKNYYDNGGLKSESSISNGEFVYAISYDKEGRVTSEEKPGSNISYSYDNDGWKHTSINGEKCQCSKCNSN